MKTYNNTNIQNLVNLLKNNERPLNNLIRRGEKLNISKKEVIKSIELLLDLDVIRTKEIMIGDGWNSRDTVIYYELIK